MTTYLRFQKPRILIGVVVVLLGLVICNFSHGMDGKVTRKPNPKSYASFEAVKVDSPEKNFFSNLKFEDLPNKYECEGEARPFEYKFSLGDKDYYLVIVEGEKKAATPRGTHVIRHRMEVLLDYSVEKAKGGEFSIRQKTHDFWVTARRPLPSQGGGPARNILIRKRWLGDTIKVWSGTDLLADNKGTTSDSQGAGVVQHLSKEIERMTSDITFRLKKDGTATDIKGPREFKALFENDFGSPFGLPFPARGLKPGESFVRVEKSPLTEITVSGQCADDLPTKPVEKRVRYAYLGDAAVGGYACSVFKVTLDQKFEGLESSRKTPFGQFPVVIETVHVQRERTIYFAREPGKVIAYDARHRTQSVFFLKTPMGDQRFETDAKVRWAMILHDKLAFAKAGSSK
jgi:hypothetical protein